ncbi:hypothetical protein EV361DRAFT_915919 [Lentinula raphanica]|nr:hypothetical protein EV361DRAFT_915919 [Lentinula raphanica]
MIKVLLLFALAWLTTSNIVKAVTTSDAIPFTEYRLLFGLCRDEGPDVRPLQAASFSSLEGSLILFIYPSGPYSNQIQRIRICNPSLR